MATRGINESIEETIKNDTSAVLDTAGDETAKIESVDQSSAIQVAGENNKMDTTQFIDDGITIKKDESHVQMMSKMITMMGQPQITETSLLDFLRKPIIIARDNFTTSDTFSIFRSYSMPHAAFTGSNGSIWADKLKGFFGMRMNMRFKLVINANKFQAGRYIMGWTPLGGAASTVSNLKNVNFIYAHNATLVQRTTVPHVELDIATNTSAELLIPFASAYKFYPLNTILSDTDYSPLGSLNIYPYSVLSAPAGNITCGYTVYLSLEEVSLYGAASPQAGGKHTAVSKSEVANRQNGPVSGIAHAISKGFKEFGNIPLLGEYAKGVSWIADRVSNVASIFGFSKPIAGDTQPKMQIINAACHSTVDGETDARPLSYLSTPGVVPIQGLAGTDLDEMDFSYLKTRYSWFRSVTWATNQTAGVPITSIAVLPGTGEVTIASTLNSGPMTFLSKHFTWWRGSLKFKFKIVKTEYHSGRLQFAFYPTELEGGFETSEAYVNRMIVDLRDHSEIEIVVPYISRTPWNYETQKIGTLSVTVVDPLVAPPTVNSIITILMEIAGGDDLEFAGARPWEIIHTRIVPQGGLEQENTIISSTIGDTEVRGNPIMMSSLCIGDKVSSVRAYTKRFCFIEKTGVNATSTLNNSTIEVIPDAIMMLASPTSVPANGFTSDFVSNWAACYLFMSGGLRIRDIIDFGLSTTDTVKYVHTSVAAVFDTNFRSAKNSIMEDNAVRVSNNVHRIYQDCSSNNTVTVEVPQYTSTFTRCVPDLIIYQDATMNTATQYNGSRACTNGIVRFYAPFGNIVSVQANYTYHKIARAGADDFNLSGFISVPPHVGYSSNNRTGLY